MTSIRRRRKNPPKALLAVVLLPLAAAADEPTYEFGGHLKTRVLAETFPDNSLFHDATGSTASALESDLRLNFFVDKGPWSLDSAWQLFAGYGDRVELSRQLAGTVAPGAGRLPNDDRRLMDLTKTITDDDKFAALHRLDRLSLGYAKGNLVARVGRQAISWGNGLLFAPMDIVNPFDPTAVDTEYKTGDDMLYGQFLRNNGDDIQFAYVFRRNPLNGDAESSQATSAIKYHGVTAEAEYDLLISRNHDETTLGIGGNRSIGGAVWRADVVLADTSSGNKLQLVTNLSYSWTWWDKNMSGVIEYYFTEFGQRSGRYDLASLARNDALLDRLARGESFTLGRNYLAGGVTIEMSPLWLLTPNLFANLDDGSALLQVVSRLSLSDNSELLAALNVPLGPSGSEFGGIDTGLPDAYLSTDLSLFAQFAFYFP